MCTTIYIYIIYYIYTVYIYICVSYIICIYIYIHLSHFKTDPFLDVGILRPEKSICGTKTNGLGSNGWIMLNQTSSTGQSQLGNPIPIIPIMRLKSWNIHQKLWFSTGSIHFGEPSKRLLFYAILWYFIWWMGFKFSPFKFIRALALKKRTNTGRQTPLLQFLEVVEPGYCCWLWQSSSVFGCFGYPLVI